MAQNNTPKPVNEGRNLRLQSIFNQPKPAQPKPRSNFDDQSSVNNVFGWLKANWSKPIPRWVSPSDTPK